MNELKEFNYKELDRWLMNNDKEIIKLIDLAISEKINKSCRISETSRFKKIPEELFCAILHGSNSYELEQENFHTLQGKCQDFICNVL